MSRPGAMARPCASCRPSARPLRFRCFLAAALFGLLAACASPGKITPETSVVAIGDSVLAFYKAQGASVPDVVGRETGLSVANLAVSGARISYGGAGAVAEGYDIRAQWKPGPWDWVIMNGGANDLLSECGCSRCAANIAGLISRDGTGGAIPELVTGILGGNSRVILLGYYDGNVQPNVFSGCSDEIDILNARLERLAADTPGVYYVDAGDVIDPRDQSHWFIDRVHPSRLGARLLGQHIAATMRAAG